jgi:hypothetical protein
MCEESKDLYKSHLNMLCKTTSSFDISKINGLAQLAFEQHGFKSSLVLIERLKKQDRGNSLIVTMIVDVVKNMKFILDFGRRFTAEYVKSRSLEDWKDPSLYLAHLSATKFYSADILAPVLSSISMQSSAVFISESRDRSFFQRLQTKLNDHFCEIGASQTTLELNTVASCLNLLELKVPGDTQAQRSSVSLPSDDKQRNPDSSKPSDTTHSKEIEMQIERIKQTCSDLHKLSEKSRSESIHQLVPEIRNFLIVAEDCIKQLESTKKPLDSQVMSGMAAKMQSLNKLLEQVKAAKSVPLLVQII